MAGRDILICQRGHPIKKDKALGQLTRDCRDGDGDGLICGAQILFDYMVGC